MVLSNVLAELGTQAVAFIPNLLGALAILIIGLIVGKIVAKVVKRILVDAKVDAYVTHRKAGIARISDVFTTVSKWVIYLVAIQASVEYLGVMAAASFVNAVLGFIPSFIEAILVLVIGYVIAEYAQEHIVASKAAYSEIVAKMVFFFMMYVALATALQLIAIKLVLVNQIVLILTLSMGLAMAIALGLGLRDSVNILAKKYIAKKRI